MSMIGHNINTEGTAVHQVNSAVAVLGIALQDLRTTTAHKRELMIIVGRALALVDDAAGGDVALADSEIKKAGVIVPTDLISNVDERSKARWMAYGGIESSPQRLRPKLINEIRNLDPHELNQIEGSFLIKRKFAKLFTYGSINVVFAREAKAEIRKALSGDGGLSLDGIRGTYAGTLFQKETVESWIRDAEYQRSEDYQEWQLVKKAGSLRFKTAETDSTVRHQLLDYYKHEVSKLMALEAEHRTEQEARKNAAKLTPSQRKLVEDSLRRGVVSDDDDDLALGDQS